MESERSPRAVDLHVGSRIRLRRTLLGMSQERLGEALGLTFQQIQKYERGVNRVGASRLYDLARVLDVAVSFFFDDMPEHLSVDHVSARADGGVRPAGFAEVQQGFGDDLMKRRETVDLVRAYYKITDPSIRRRMYDLMRSMNAADEV